MQVGVACSVPALYAMSPADSSFPTSADPAPQWGGGEAAAAAQEAQHAGGWGNSTHSPLCIAPQLTHPSLHLQIRHPRGAAGRQQLQRRTDSTQVGVGGSAPVTFVKRSHLLEFLH